EWRRWLLVGVAAVGARTAAMALNRLIDRRLDRLNPRTRGRELPAERMNLGEAWALLAGSSMAYLVACAALGSWFIRVSWIPLAVFVIYPYLKRLTPLCHLGVGAALALALPAGGDTAGWWPLAATVPLGGAGTLLLLEQRWAENVNLAFFKVNVWVGFAVLALVLAARAATPGGL